MRRVATLTILLSLVALAGDALAEPPSFADCGLVKAYTPATTANAGSITIGSKTIALAVADRMPADRAAIGQVMCLHQTVTTAGPVLELLPLPTPLCGASDSLPFTATPDRIDLQIAPGFRAVFFTAPGFRVASVAPGSRVCLRDARVRGGLGNDLSRHLRHAGHDPTVTPRNLPSTCTSASSIAMR